MGPKLISKKSKKTGIAYSLRLLPFGGFVSMVGENDEGMIEADSVDGESGESGASDASGESGSTKTPVQDPRALCQKPVWQRIIITAAGGVMNLLLGLILSAVFVCSSEVIGAPIVAQFSENAVSQKQGLMLEDVITHVNGKPVSSHMEVSYAILHDGFEPVDLTVRRNVTFRRNDEGVVTSWSGGDVVELKDVTFGTEETEGIVLGQMDFKVLRVAKTPFNVIGQTFGNMRLAVRQVWDGLVDLITGHVGVDQVSGPVGVTNEIGKAASMGFSSFIYIVLVITVNLGLLNLFPIPALDGGRIVFQLIELIFRKPVPRRIEGLIHMAALMVLMLFMLIVTGRDLFKLFG